MSFAVLSLAIWNSTGFSEANFSLPELISPSSFSISSSVTLDIFDSVDNLSLYALIKFFLKFFFAYSANTSLKFGKDTPPYWLAEILAIICIAMFIAVPTEFGWQTSALVILVPFLSISSILKRQQLVSLVSTSESCQCIVFFL